MFRSTDPPSFWEWRYTLSPERGQFRSGDMVEKVNFILVIDAARFIDQYFHISLQQRDVFLPVAQGQKIAGFLF